MAANRREIGQAGQESSSSGRRLGALELTGLGVGSIIGAGFFLGSGIVIHQVGPAILLTYLLGGLAMAQVMGAITSLAVNVPVKTSYQEYIAQYLGAYPGFFLGWAVFASGALCIGSEAVAMAEYSRYWLPTVPVGAFAVGYVLLVVLLNSFGVESLGKVETLMSVVKAGILVVFVSVALVLVAGVARTPQTVGLTVLLGRGGFFPKGILPVFSGMLIVVFSYAGVTTVAMATAQARHPRESVPRAADYTTFIIAGLYVLSLLSLLLLAPWDTLTASRSPFVAALQGVRYFGLARMVNVVILIASFSVMAGAFYAVQWMLVGLAGQGDAPARFRQRGRLRPYPALLATSLTVLVTLVLAFVLPRSVYTDLTAASSYFTFVNWLFILLAFLAWHHGSQAPRARLSRLAFAPPYGALATVAVVAALGAYSVTVQAFQLGFWVFLGISLGITVAWGFQRGRRAPAS